MRIKQLVLLASMASLAVGTTRTAAAQSRSCAARLAAPWRDLELPDGRKAFVEQPQLVMNGGRLWMIGVFAETFDSTAMSGRIEVDPSVAPEVAGLMQDSSGRLSAIPRSAFRPPLISPTLSGSRPERLLWSTDAGWISMATLRDSLWFPGDSVAGAWREPPWDHGGPVVRHDSVFVLKANDGDSLTLLVHAAGGWSERGVPHARFARVVALAATDSDLIVAYVGAVRERRDDPTALYAMTSRDAGATWPMPSLVAEPRRSEGGSAVNGLNVIADGGRVHAIWGDGLGDRLSYPVIRIATYTAAGGWIESPAWSPDNGVGAMRSYPDGQGGIDVTGVDGEDGVWYAHWSAAGWCANQLPGTEGAIPTPGFVRLSNTRAIITSSRIHSTTNNRFIPTTRIATLETCCSN